MLLKKHHSWTSSDKARQAMAWGWPCFFGTWPLVTTAFAPLLLLGAVLTKNVVRSPANYRWIWHGGWMTLLGVKIWAMVLVHLNKRTPRLGILYVYYSNHLNFISHITTQCYRELIFIYILLAVLVLQYSTVSGKIIWHAKISYQLINCLDARWNC